MRALFLVVLFGCGHGEGGPIGPIIPDGPPIPRNCSQGETCVQGTTCEIEGIAACNGAPVSGGCSCTLDSGWDCFSSCPPGCPTDLPVQGASCTVSATCPYDDPPFSPDRIECRCIDSAFDCQPV